MPTPEGIQQFSPYDFELVPGTERDAKTAAHELKTWNNGGELHSAGIAVATIHPREDEVNAALAALGEKHYDIGIIGVPGLPFVDHEVYLEKWRLLAPEIQVVAGGLAATLQQVVDADIARSMARMRRPNGNGQIRLSAEPSKPDWWHVDNLTQTPEECVFEAGMQRYVVTFGALGPNGESPSTDFVEGIIKGRDIVNSSTGSSAVHDGKVVTHAAGVVARFDARFGLHRQPSIYGPRIFATTSALEIPARKVFPDETLD